MSPKKKTDPAEAPPASPVDPDVALVEAAFAAGNNSAVRHFAATSTSPAAKEAAQRLMAKVVVDRQQLLAGLIGLIVVSVVAALTLTRG
jgi:hypothetical protein